MTALTLPRAGQQVPPRRTFMGHLVGAVAAAGILHQGTKPAAVKAGPDDELLAACRAFFDTVQVIDDWEDDRGDARTGEAAAREWYVHMEKITPMRPRTMAGLSAKAAVAYRAMASLKDFGLGREETIALAVLADVAAGATAG